MKKVNPILLEYKENEKYFILHEDDIDLVPLKIYYPERPPFEDIEGYGLHAKEQKFQREVIPNKLARLIKDSKTNQEIWNTLTVKQYDYRNEIEWLKQQWVYFFRGKYFFNNGIPTYIDGDYWFYLNYWHLDVGLPEYRDAHRRASLAELYFENTTVDYYGKDWGRKIFCGINKIAGRRWGKSFWACSKAYKRSITSILSNISMQSKDDTSASTLYKDKLIAPFKKVPFFFVPQYKPGFESELEFDYTIPRAQGDNVSEIKVGLQTKIRYYAATLSKLDGDKNIFILNDEIGKTITVNAYRRYYIQKECVQQGNKIIGFIMNFSNVGDMVSGGGDNYEMLFKESFINKINNNGQTKSGLANIFIPAYDGLEGYIDEYGMSVIDTPTPEQAKYINSEIGAKEFLNNKKKQFIEDEDFESLANEQRKFSTNSREAFASGESGKIFNLAKCNKRLGELSFMPEYRVRGDFRWINKPIFSPKRGYMVRPEVEFVVNINNGRWYLSYQPPRSKTNLLYWDEEGHSWKPENPREFSLGADPFKVRKVKELQGSHHSKGGCTVYRPRDLTIDPDGKPLEEWETEEPCATYCYRTEKPEEFCEDILKANIYFGGLMNPESNVGKVEECYEDWGFKGYLNYDIDKNGVFNEYAGGFTTGGKNASNQKLFLGLIDWHVDHVCHCKHPEIIEELINTKGVDDLPSHDLFVSFAYAKDGAQNNYIKQLLRSQEEEEYNEDETIDLLSIYR